jgi:hypothetical protein
MKMRDRIKAAVSGMVDRIVNPRLERLLAERVDDAVERRCETLEAHGTLSRKMAQAVASNIDYSELADHVCAEDVANAMDASEVAGHIEASEVAEEVSVDTDDVVDRLDYKALAKHLLEEVRACR